MSCDPCQFCQNLYDDSDESVGLYGYGCMAADDGKETFDQVKPCPCFKPYPSSWGLFNEIDNEYEAQFYQEGENDDPCD